MTIMGSAANITSRPRGKLEKKKDSGVAGVQELQAEGVQESGVAGVQNVRSRGAIKEWSTGVEAVG
jgi:hypothetical protein